MTKDRVFWLACLTAAASIVVLAVLLLGFLIVDSWQAIATLGFGFFTRSDWDPVHNQYGALAFVYGTLATSLTAMLIAVPLSVGSAAFLAEIAPAGCARPVHSHGFWRRFPASSMAWGIFLADHSAGVRPRGRPNHGGVGLTAASDSGDQSFLSRPSASTCAGRCAACGSRSWHGPTLANDLVSDLA